MELRLVSVTYLINDETLEAAKRLTVLTGERNLFL
jgi:hypothetical protein